LGLVYGTSWWIMEFNLDNCCDNHNHPFNKVLVSFAIDTAYDAKWRRNREYV
jgi:hypothetical protein